MSDAVILHLILKKKWFNLIKNGTKKIEYREIKDHWIKRIWDRKPTHVIFHRGYTNDTIVLPITKIDMNVSTNQFEIHLGDLIYSSTIIKGDLYAS